MKALILAGGLGTRISEETVNKPKPMVKIGNLTLMEHIMNIYEKSGITEFIIATGYLHKVIEEFFLNFTKFKVDTVFTGELTKTGGRIKRVFEIYQDKSMCVTYGDGLGNVDVAETINFHNNHGRLATVTAVQPQPRFGRLKIEGNAVVNFGEKMQSEEGWVNGGFFVLDRQISQYIEGDNTPFEQDPLSQLTNLGELMAYKHFGFWSPVDSLREKQDLEMLWINGDAPWTRK